MAKTSVKNKICQSCGADVRPGSLFCYNCGSAVEPASVEAEIKGRRKTVKEALIEEGVNEGNGLKTTRLDAEPLPTPVAAAQPEKPTIQEEAKLKSAANLRRKAKSYQRKPVEVVWEEPDQAPNKWFPLVAVILLLFVLLIFYLAMYLK
jgi:hypothetical protein